MKVKVECDCGETYEVTLCHIRDTTKCSCGSCRGESYEVVFVENCPKCGKDNRMTHEN